MATDWDWLTPDFYSQAYDRFIKLRWNINPFPGEDHNLEPGDFDLLPKEKEGIPIPIFGASLISISIQRLAGQINGFHSDLFKLKAWEKILPEYDRLQKLHLIDEFVEPLLTSCLIAPYALKNQMIFSGTKIAIMLEMGQRQPKIPDDKAINYPLFQKWAGDWAGFAAFANSLKSLDDQSFKNSTDTFRDRYTHRLPPSIEMGIVPNYQFKRETNGLRIYPRMSNPLPLSASITAAVIQHRACVATFREFWTMLKVRLAAPKKSHRKET